MNLGIVTIIYLIVLVVVFAGVKWLARLSSSIAAIVAATIGLFVIVLGAQQKLESSFEKMKFLVLSFVAAFIFVATFSVLFAERSVGTFTLRDRDGR